MASLSGFEEETLIRSILFRTPQIGEDDPWLCRASFGQSTSLKILSLSDICLHWPVMSCIIKALDSGLTAHILSLSGDSVTTKVLTGPEKVANTIIAQLALEKTTLYQVLARTSVMILELLQLKEKVNPSVWCATVVSEKLSASLIALSCGLEFEFQNKGVGNAHSIGLLAACKIARVNKIKVLTNAQCPILFEAIGILGLGSRSVVHVGDPASLVQVNFEHLERELSEPDTLTVVSMSSGEISCKEEALDIIRIRNLCSKYGAWFHLNAAPGFSVQVLRSNSDFAPLTRKLEGMPLVDSMTGGIFHLLGLPSEQSWIFIRHKAIAETIIDLHGYTTFPGDLDNASPLIGHTQVEVELALHTMPTYVTLLLGGYESYSQTLEKAWKSRITPHTKNKQ